MSRAVVESIEARRGQSGLSWRCQNFSGRTFGPGEDFRVMTFDSTDDDAPALSNTPPHEDRLQPLLSAAAAIYPRTGINRMPTRLHLPDTKPPAHSSQQSVMSEPQAAPAGAQKKRKPAVQKTEAKTDPPAPLPTIKMVGGPTDANDSSTFRGRVSRRGGRASQRTTQNKRSMPPSPLNDTGTCTKKKQRGKKKAKPFLPPAGWEVIRNVALPRKFSTDPSSSFGLGKTG